MAKKYNYNGKFGQALANLIKKDEDLWIKGPNENAFNSNLYRRVKSYPDHTIDMEYDKYAIKAIIAMLANPELKKYIQDKTSKGDYNPKPDIIIHNDVIRSEESIFAIAEGKFSKDKTGIWEDFLKLSAYRLAFGENIEYLNLIIYPQKGSANPKYKRFPPKKNRVWNKTNLYEKLDALCKDEGTVLHATPFSGTLEQFFRNMNSEEEVWLNDDKSEFIYQQKVDSITTNNIKITFDIIMNKIIKFESIKDEEFNALKETYSHENINFLDDNDNHPLNNEQLYNILNFYSAAGCKKRSIHSREYLRAGADIQEVPYNLEHDKFEPFQYWRNVCVVMYEGDRYKLLLNDVSSDQELAGFERTSSKYSENANTIWTAFELIENKNNFTQFNAAVTTNQTIITEIVINSYQKILRKRDLKNILTGEYKTQIENKINALQETIR